MIWLLMPIASIAFAFIVSVLLDLRAGKRIVLENLTDHFTKAATYLACIGVAELLRISQPEMGAVIKLAATSFTGLEILQTLSKIRAAFGSSDPAVQALEQVAQAETQALPNVPQVAQAPDRFDVLKK